jgi:hypothetical protein
VTALPVHGKSGRQAVKSETRKKPPPRLRKK